MTSTVKKLDDRTCPLCCQALKIFADHHSEPITHSEAQMLIDARRRLYKETGDPAADELKFWKSAFEQERHRYNILLKIVRNEAPEFQDPVKHFFECDKYLERVTNKFRSKAKVVETQRFCINKDKNDAEVKKDKKSCCKRMKNAMKKLRKFFKKD